MPNIVGNMCVSRAAHDVTGRLVFVVIPKMFRVTGRKEQFEVLCPAL